MRVAPTSKSPPWSYRLSKILSQPKGEQTIDAVIHRLRKFHRDGLLFIGSRILWHLRDHPELVGTDSPARIGNYVTRAYAERLIVLACSFASPHNRPWPQKVDFHLLCWELFECADGDFLGPDALQQMTERLQQLVKGSPDSPLRKLDTSLARDFLVEAFKARNVSVQLAGRYLNIDEYIRPLLIAREMRELARAHAGEAVDIYERQFFLTSQERFFRGAWALYMKANTGVSTNFQGHGGPAAVQERGRINSSDWPPDHAILDEMGLTGDDLRAVASRLATPLSHYQEFRPVMHQQHPFVRKYDPVTDWLAKRPLIDLEIGGRCEQLIAPSPWKFLAAIGDCMLYDYVAFLQDKRNVALNGMDAYSLRGEAFGNYLRSVLRERPGLYDLDTFDGLKSSNSRPDFLWLGQEYGVLVEAKFSLRPNTDRAMKDASATLETWRRAAEPITQASRLLHDSRMILERKMRLPQKWVLAIVSNEDFIEESIGFKGVARAGRLLDGTGLDALAMLSPSDFEDWVFFGTPDDLARRTVDVWSELTLGELQQDLRVVRHQDQPRPELPHIAEVLRFLFPVPGKVP